MRFVNDFEITVKKEDLLKALKVNRAKHAETYTLAVEQYKKECLEALQQRIAIIHADWTEPSKFLRFDLAAPVAYVHEYDTIIGMLEMAKDEEFEITGSTYRAWVMDEWDWKGTFVTNSVFYAKKMRPE